MRRLGFAINVSSSGAARTATLVAHVPGGVCFVADVAAAWRLCLVAVECLGGAAPVASISIVCMQFYKVYVEVVESR